MQIRKIKTAVDKLLSKSYEGLALRKKFSKLEQIMTVYGNGTELKLKLIGL